MKRERKQFPLKELVHSQSIKTKLIAGFSFLLIIMGSVSLIPLLTYKAPISQYNKILTSIENENNVINLIEEIENTLQNSLLISSNEVFENFEEDYNKKMNEINQSMDIIQQNISTQELKEIFKRNKIVIDKFEENSNNIIALKKRGYSSVSELSKMLENSRDISGFINEDFKEFIEKDIDYSANIKSRINETTKINLSLSIGIVVVILFACLTLSFIIVRSISKPIEELKNLMGEAANGDFEVRFSSKSNDEIGQLGSGFNQMIYEINNLVNMVYAEQKSKREAELKILQAQIKPHFLYNTLETILAIAEENKVDEIAEIVIALTNFFRLSLGRGKETITIKDELEQVRSYLAIQKVRYGDKLDYEINCDNEILSRTVLKLILQPLVENSIYHGIKEKPGKGKISIEAHERDGKLYFSITDNGKGIPFEKLSELSDNLRDSINVRGYGLFNVNERIKLSFSKEYGIFLKSKYGEGTKVEIWHPIISNE
jgi:sensor histidine kinase YesM